MRLALGISFFHSTKRQGPLVSPTLGFRRSRAAVLFFLILALSTLPVKVRADTLGTEIRTLRVTGETRNVIAEDFDGDGKKDLLVLAAEPLEEEYRFVRRFFLFLQKKQGFSEKPDLIWELDRRTVMIDAGEVDPAGPGREIVLFSASGVYCLVLKDGRPRGLPVRLVDSPGLLERPDPATAVRVNLVRDFNGDGKDEILFPGRDGLVLYGRSPEEGGKLPFRPLAAFKVPYKTRVCTHDENDIIFSRLELHEVMTTSLVPRIFVADADADGRPDIYFTQDDRFFLFIQKKDGSYSEKPVYRRFGIFSLEELERFSRLHKLTRLRVGDLNGDGYADVWASKTNILSLERLDILHETWVYLSEGGVFGEKPTNYYVTKGFSEQTTARDINGDGYRDLVIQHFPFGLMQLVRFIAFRSLKIYYDVYQFDPKKGRYPAAPTFDIAYSFGFRSDVTDSSFAASHLMDGDFDGDGRADFMQSRGPGEITLSLSDEDEYAGGESLDVSVPSSFFMTPDDLDGDGRTDLIFRYEHIPDLNDKVIIVYPRPAKP